MNQSLHKLHYNELSTLYRKFKARLDKAFKERRFNDFSKRKQRHLLARLEKIKERLLSLEQILKLSGSALALGLVLNGNAQAQSTYANGNEFLVSNSTQWEHKNPAVAVDSDGDYVVVWGAYNSDRNPVGDIYAQRYNASGVAQGAEFLVNTYTTDNQRDPSVAMDDNGNFVIAWGSYGQDYSGYGVYAQRYSADGTPQGTEFRVNEQTGDSQYEPSVAMDSDGDFVITWGSNNQDGDNSGVYALRYNASGVAQGNEFKVNTYTTDYQNTSTIAMDDGGNFVITWMSHGQDGSEWGIYGQRYNASGIVQGDEFKVNTNVTNYQRDQSVAMDSDGDFVVAWTSNAIDPYNYEVYAQRYNSAGIAQGSEFRVNNYTTYMQYSVSVGMDSYGDFVVAWASNVQDGNSYGVFAKRYDATGNIDEAEFQVNTYTTNDQRYTAVAVDTDGDYIVAWVSGGQNNGYDGIYAQRYDVPAPVASNQSSVTNVGIQVYPNPAKDQAQITLEGTVQVRILDLSGSLIKQEMIENKMINLKGLQTGVYMLELTQNGKTALQKLIVE